MSPHWAPHRASLVNRLVHLAGDRRGRGSAEAIETGEDDAVLKFLLWYAMSDGTGSRKMEWETLNPLTGKTRVRYALDDLNTVLRAEDISRSAIESLMKWLQFPFDNYRSGVSPEMIEAMAVHCSIDLEADWPMSCTAPDSTWLQDYLGLLTTNQLADLIAEWDMAVPVANQKRKEIIESIVQSFNDHPLPKALADVKPIDLK